MKNSVRKDTKTRGREILGYLAYNKRERSNMYND